ncbi:MAG: hypothetical protein GX612_08955 [Bacteroidales bacterium]|nr:hypothetical protein [Bacteroidales bacterium]
MKIKIFFVLLVFFSMFLFSFSKKTSVLDVKFEVLKHYNQNELRLLLQQQKYPKQFTINLNKRTIILYSDQNYNTILTLYDNNGTLLDSLAVMFMYQLANSCNMY